jgi:diguanylate cyclase (GGDEF)-like protein
MPTLYAEAAKAPSLNKVLAQSRHLDALVGECAQALSSINVLLRREWIGSSQLPKLESALDEGEAVERKLRDASQELSVLREALEAELRERIMVDHQLAAAMEQEQGSRRAAFHDVLTGLPNRSLFNNRLEHAFAQAQRHGRTLAVMFVDLDDFKLINDSHGHDAGDGVLQAVAERLEANVRGEDTVSRHGGDEFLCLLTDVQAKANAAVIAKKLIRAMQAPCHLRIGDLDITPTIKASIGISIFPKDGRTAEALVKSADAAMYRAKRTKSQYSFAR